MANVVRHPSMPRKAQPPRQRRTFPIAFCGFCRTLRPVEMVRHDAPMACRGCARIDSLVPADTPVAQQAYGPDYAAAVEAATEEARRLPEPPTAPVQPRSMRIFVAVAIAATVALVVASIVVAILHEMGPNG